MENQLFEKLCESIKEVTEHAKGERDLPPEQIRFFDEPNPRAIRSELDMTQQQFSALLAVPLGTVRNWEQGRRRPQGAAKTLLRIAEQDPESLLFDSDKETIHTKHPRISSTDSFKLTTSITHHKGKNASKGPLSSSMRPLSFSKSEKVSSRRKAADDYSYAMAA